MKSTLRLFEVPDTMPVIIDFRTDEGCAPLRFFEILRQPRRLIEMLEWGNKQLSDRHYPWLWLPASMSRWCEPADILIHHALTRSILIFRPVSESSQLCGLVGKLQLLPDQVAYGPDEAMYFDHYNQSSFVQVKLFNVPSSSDKPPRVQTHARIMLGDMRDVVTLFGLPHFHLQSSQFDETIAWLYSQPDFPSSGVPMTQWKTTPLSCEEEEVGWKLGSKRDSVSRYLAEPTPRYIIPYATTPLAEETQKSSDSIDLHPSWDHTILTLQ